jgi:glycosyltransferase involved in cell wall biosynthesis
VARRPHDIYHATFYDPSAVLALRGAKLVVTVLDMIPEHFPDYFHTTGLYGRFVTKRWIAGKRKLCERADAILAISETTKRDVIAFYGIDPDRITVTHLGNRLVSDRSEPRLSGFPDRYLLFVGTRNTYKNFPFFVEGVAPVLANDPSLHVVCIGGGAFDTTERSLIERIGLTDRVVQHSVSDRELAACYAHAVAFVFPSLYEGFGIPILEAFGCGCPAIVADASCFPEIAGDAARYFDPKDRESLRAAVAEIIDKPVVADELRRKGRERARAFTWEATAQKTIAVYRELCR